MPRLIFQLMMLAPGVALAMMCVSSGLLLSGTSWARKFGHVAHKQPNIVESVVSVHFGVDVELAFPLKVVYCGCAISAAKAPPLQGCRPPDSVPYCCCCAVSPCRVDRLHHWQQAGTGTAEL